MGYRQPAMTELSDKRFVHLFSTPIVEHRWPDVDSLNAELRKIVLAREKDDKGEVRSNAGGWHSQGDFERWSGETGQQLIQRLGKQINHATALYYRNHTLKEPIRWRVTMWANVNRKGHFNRTHIHPGATWSGVYYVDEGDEAVDNKESGAFVLHHPNLAAAMGFFPEITPQSYVVRPVAGLMLVFPSYLPHEVYPYFGKRPRISIAFNAKRE
ncbi:MAG: hypothetical protein FJX65_13380 [Alphaproteobacteria bacterium]|nr:hypothetical protein [Alphaproteobacteria bacterium]